MNDESKNCVKILIWIELIFDSLARRSAAGPSAVTLKTALTCRPGRHFRTDIELSGINALIKLDLAFYND